MDAAKRVKTLEVYCAVLTVGVILSLGISLGAVLGSKKIAPAKPAKPDTRQTALGEATHFKRLSTELIGIFDEKGTPRITLECTKGGLAAITLFRDDMSIGSMLAVDPQGRSFFTLTGKNGLDRFEFTVDENDAAGMFIRDSEGRKRIHGITKGEIAAFGIFRADGKIVQLFGTEK